MTVQDVDTGTLGAKRQSFHEISLRADLLKVMKANPTATKEELSSLLWRVMKDGVDSGKDYLSPLLDYWFPGNYKSILKQQQKATQASEQKASDTSEQQPDQATGQASEPQRAAQGAQAAEDREAEELVNNLIDRAARLILMDLMLPNGKPLRDCTGDECAKAGGWFASIAGQVKPDDIVGKVLSEEQVRTLYDR
jgi:hypothetical protein